MKCAICGRPVLDCEVVCQLCQRGYSMGEGEANQEGCRYCGGTGTYTSGGREYNCTYCN